MTVLVFGHRGASAAFPENTVEAFVGAREMGADGVELDARRTRDAALAVHHDSSLADGRLIVDLDAAELPSEVCLLDDALTACEGMAVVNVEIKNVPQDPDYDPTEWVAAQVARVVAERKLVPRVVASSFNLKAIERVREVDASIRRGYLTDPRWDQYAALEAVVEGGHHVLHPHHLVVNAQLVERCHEAGVSVTTWTVNEPDRMRWLAFDCGVDAIITDHPDLALATLR